jgi:hypothetical protein
VVDTDGKLIVGKYRKVYKRLITAYINNCDFQTTSSYLFYADYLIVPIRQSYFETKRIREKQEEEENIEEVNFDVIDINNKVKLAITPLTQW